MLGEVVCFSDCFGDGEVDGFDAVECCPVIKLLVSALAIKEMLSKHFFDVKGTGHEAGTTPFVGNENNDVVVSAELIHCVTLGDGKVGGFSAIVGEVFAFVDEVGGEHS